jgi:hypothetical protein
MTPHSENALLQLVSEAPHSKNLQDRLRDRRSVVLLSPKLSSHLVEKLASIESNRGGMRAVTESLLAPKRFQNAAALQEDAVRNALNAFGVGPNDAVVSLELVEGKDTALARVPIMEDSVIEHDARNVPGYELVQSDLTGRAVFEKGIERLEVFTANRRSLEHVFGVDLIYLNATRQNIVMLQYKMLESAHGDDPASDWIYRPDASLDDELSRMKKFTTERAPGPKEYRLNPSVFFLKFVKRNGMIANGGITIPVEHFEQLLQDPICQGPKGGLRISFQSLGGRYLRQGAFLDLLRSGYIGAHAEVTAHMRVLVEAVLNGNRAVVAAIQSPKDPADRLGNEPDESDGKAD